MSGSSYYSQNDFRLHFGLGAATKADTVELTWPSGARDTLRDVPGNRLVVVEEGRGIANGSTTGQ